MPKKRLMLVSGVALLLLLVFVLGDKGALTIGLQIPSRSPLSCEAHLETVTPSPPPLFSLGKLAYIQAGDIWVKALPDRDAQRLTVDGSNYEPRWSPSGQWLAFRKATVERGGDPAWVMRADGSEARPLDQGANIRAFAWSPKADRLAYITGDGTLMAEDADGSSPQELVGSVGGTPGRGVFHVSWSPDGAWLAYDRVERLQEEERAKDPFGRSASLWRIRADGTGATEILRTGAPEFHGLIVAGWSPDGSRILYRVLPFFSPSILADGVPLLTMPAQGGTPVELAKAVLDHRDFLALGPAIADRLAVVVGGYRGTWTKKALYVFSPSTGRGRALTAPDEAATSPTWSPDGQWLAYAAMPDRGDLVGGESARLGLMQRRLFVVKAQEDGGPRQLTEDTNYRDEYPLWSANSAFLLFARLNAEGNQASLWLLPVEGGQPRQVVEELSGDLGTRAPLWFGYYGHVVWDRLFDWWRGP